MFWFLSHGKRDFEDLIKLRIWGWEEYSGLSELAQCNNYKGPGPHMREAGGSVRRRTCDSRRMGVSTRERDLKIL